MPAEINRKHSEERITFEFDFTGRPEILAGDSLDSSGVATVTAETVIGPPADPELVLGTPVIGDNVVQVAIEGGTNWADYCVTCLAPTLGGQTLAGVGKLIVRDDCEAD